MTVTAMTAATPQAIRRRGAHNGPAASRSEMESAMPEVDSAGPSATQRDGGRLPGRVKVATHLRRTLS